MPLNETTQQNASMSDLAALPGDVSAQEVGQAAGIPGLGGPGVDTPQEQQAVKALMEGAKLFREAATADPSIRYIVDKLLQDGFGQVTKHYGFEQEGKLALQQASLQKDRAQAAAVSGQGPSGQAPVGGAQGGVPAAAPIEY